MNYLWGGDEIVVFDKLIPVNDIITGKNVRSDIGDITDLVESISNVGIINPLVVTETSEGFILVAGERRFRAAEQLGFEFVPCKVFKDISDSQIYEIMLAENFNRESMSAIDEAKAFRMMLDRYGYTQEKLGGIVGRSQSYIANHLRLLELPEDIQDLIVKGTLSPAHGLQFLSFRDSVLYGSLMDYFMKNIPSQIKPVSQFKDQIQSFAFDSARASGIDSRYLSIYQVGEDAYRSKCVSCPNHLGSHCYNITCFDVLSKEYSESKMNDYSDDDKESVEDHNREVARIVKAHKREYVQQLNQDIEGDIDRVLRDSGLDAQGLFDRFINHFTQYDDEDDPCSDEGGICSILSYGASGYVASRLTAESTLDDLMRLLVGTFLLWEFEESYTTPEEILTDYVKVLRDHGFSSDRFNKSNIKKIETDIRIFDKKIEDIEASGVAVSPDVSDLPLVDEEASE